MTLTDTGAIGYRATGRAAALLVLAHGAGAGQHHPFMVSVARGLSERGIDVVTFDFPYIRERRGAPDRPPLLEKAFRQAIEAARDWSAAGNVFIGGKSMGGRIATHLASQEPAALRGAVVLGYPLHPPGKPNQLRVEHWPGIAIPLLIVQGERDAFGTPAELSGQLAAIAAEVAVHVIGGGDHSFAVSKRTKADVLAEIVHVVAGWIEQGARPPA